MSASAPPTAAAARAPLFQEPGSVPAVPPAQWQQFMGIDYGQKRTGVAVGNRITGTATPCKSVAAQGDARFAALATLIAQWQPQALVIGIPYHPDGAAHDNTRKALAFGRQLALRYRLPVYTVDERYSTTEALSRGAADADAAAACIILEQFLNQHP